MKDTNNKKDTAKQNNEYGIINMDNYAKYIENGDESERKTEVSDVPGVFEDVSSSSGKHHKGPNAFTRWWRRLKKWQKVIIIVVAVLIVIAAVLLGIVYGVLGGFKGTNLKKSDLSVDTNDAYVKSGYVNIAVFGLDTREANSFSGRSDSIIIASVNRKTGDIKLTSILRDSYVAIDGYQNQKITHAYALGGASLAVKTINENFNMNIEDYVTFNFAKLATLIDLTGGIDINITETEREEMNRIGPDDGRKYTAVPKAGYVHLNGMQAVIYSRIRETDSDVARAGRQRKVIMCLFNNCKKLKASQYSDFVDKAMQCCETSLSSSEILAYSSLLSKKITIETLVVPGDEDNAVGGIYNGSWVWRYDLGAAANRIHKFIYGASATTAASTTTTTYRKYTGTYYTTVTTARTTTTTTTEESTTDEDTTTSTTEKGGTTKATTKTTTESSSTSPTTETTSAP